jgi:preprotein translocase subunit SecA
MLEGFVQKEYKEEESIFDKIINHISNSITDDNGKCLQEIFKDIKKSLTSFIQDICTEYLPEDKTSKLQNELQKLFNKNLITSVENAMNVKEGSQASEQNVAQVIKKAIASSVEKTFNGQVYKLFKECKEKGVKGSHLI